jgi:adenosylcobinamide-GDP ribazoletransferase
VFALLELALPGSPYSPFAAAVACTAATVLLTGAFHEGGLTHVADGLAGAVEGNEAIELMSDSRLGSTGAVSLVLALFAKVALLAVLAGQSPAAVLAALLAGHVISRFWPLLLMRALPYIGDASTVAGKPLADRIDARTLAIGAAWCVLPLANALLVQPAAFTIVALIFSALALFSMQRLFARRLKGFTADCVGATQQVCEIAFYLGAAIGLGLA